ncbi:PPOX class F420-dependent oxidoreductase [Actinacidiphila sp. ITFR-21]|uniref:PPOX class F420-dependent oxidoreductase n=1 Tax=Actinacidiphila sp. ITFR-21 TaxID=3075199 RepID=UPI00288A9F2D|nr:PPOX class F420-dependent oxidoreductase [Streptomyces sp. ITFR-21]WNI17052.1 PPOX class F420-dependent oxidoreductase [Streptomyces sp. ITFR-21]
MAALSDAARALIDGKNFATVGTIQPDGRPQLSLVWVDRDGDDVLFSTLEGRRKHANLVADPRITLLISPVENPYAYLEIRGTATLETEGVTQLIHDLGIKYTGEPYGDGAKAPRVTVRISADHVVEYGL